MDQRISLVIDMIEQRLAEPLDIRTLAAEVNLSPSHLTRLFLESTGTTPGRFLRRLRLERARTLFLNTTLSVREVRALVGCTDRSHFARDYRLLYGVTPRQSRAARSRSRHCRDPEP